MLYRLAIALSKPVRYAYGLFSSKFRKRETGSQEHLELLEREYRATQRGYDVWFHAASMGEFSQAEPIIMRIKEKKPETRILVSVFSPSGFENIHDLHSIDKLVYLPFDTPENATRFVTAVRPKLALFIRYEIWRNILNQLESNGIPKWMLAFAPPNSKSSAHVLSGFYVSGLQKFDRIYPVSVGAAAYLARVGVYHRPILPDPRYDGMINKLSKSGVPDGLRNRILSIAGDRLVVVIGSGWPEDDKVIADSLLTLKDDIFVIHVPHEPKDGYISALQALYSNPIAMSDLEAMSSSEILKKRYDTLLIDRIGLLLQLYQLADMAYVGGGFGAGVHSVGEPIASLLPVAAGADKILSSPESAYLLSEGLLTSVANSVEFSHWLSRCGSRELLAAQRSKAENVLNSLTGASEVYAIEILKCLDEIA